MRRVGLLRMSVDAPVRDLDRPASERNRPTSIHQSTSRVACPPSSAATKTDNYGITACNTRHLLPRLSSGLKKCSLCHHDVQAAVAAEQPKSTALCGPIASKTAQISVASGPVLELLLLFLLSAASNAHPEWCRPGARFNFSPERAVAEQ